MNQHFYVRQGTGFIDMTEAQRAAAIGLLRAGLSAKGLKLTQDIMKLNHTLGELTNNNFEEYGEGRYYLTVMGTPSAKEPWGWQLDGHHCNVNYFVLGDQVVMSPAFFGSEPVIAHAGKFKGTVVLQDEQNKGLAMINALTEAQRKKAILSVSKTGNNNLGEAFKDNFVLDYTGIRASELTAKQKEQLLALVGEYVGQHERWPRQSENERGAQAPRQHLVCLDRRDGIEECFLLSHSQSGDSGRIRSSVARRIAQSSRRNTRAKSRARSHRRPYPEWERLRQGFASPALPTTSALACGTGSLGDAV